MSDRQIAEIVKSNLIIHFNIQPNQFCWEKPLEELDTDFKVLGFLAYLEQLLTESLSKKIPLIENIGTSFHTPTDVVRVIQNVL